MIRRLLCTLGLHHRIPIRHTRHLYRCTGNHPGVWLRRTDDELGLRWEKAR